MEYGKKTENHVKWETSTWRLEKWRNHWKTWKLEIHTVGPGIWRENWKSRKMRNTHFRTRNMARKPERGGKFRNIHCRTWNMARKLKIMENEKHQLDDMINDKITEKCKIWEMHTVGPGIWRENWKSRKMKNTHFRTRNMARKPEKGGKFRNVHCRTWNMARKLKIMGNEKRPLDNLKNDEITEKHEKWEMHTVGPGIWRETWKSRKMRNIHLTTWKMTKSLKNVKKEKCTL
jgi:co-chaperonin GroES (HSP10)